MQLTQQVNNLKDRFRSNPNLLQRRYQMSKDLIDLIALQQLKAEKEQAVKQINMSLQMNPATIKQQREREVMGLTQNQVAQGVGSALRQKQAQQQSNLRRVAQTGIAGRAPTMGMAEGGIVGFATAGSVGFGDDYQAEVERIQNLDIPREQKLALLQRLDQRSAKKNIDTQQFLETGILTPDMLAKPNLDQLPKGADQLDAKNYSIDRSANPFTEQLKTGIAALQTDPKQASADRYDESLSRIGYTPTEAKTISDLNRERKALEEQFLDPELLRQNRLKKGLIGGAGKSTIGLTGAGYAAGSLNEALAQQKGASELFNRRDKAFKDVIAKSQDIREAADAQAGAAASDAAADRRTSINALSTMQKQFDENANADMERLLRIDVRNAESKDAERANQLRVILDGVSDQNKLLIGNQTVIYQQRFNDIREEANRIEDKSRRLQVITNGINDLAQRKGIILAGIQEDLEVQIANVTTIGGDETKQTEAINELKRRFREKEKAVTRELDKELAFLTGMRKNILQSNFKVRKKP